MVVRSRLSMIIDSMRYHPRYSRPWALVLALFSASCGGPRGGTLVRGGSDASARSEAGFIAGDGSGSADATPESGPGSQPDSAGDDASSEGGMQDEVAVPVDADVAVRGQPVGSACGGHDECASALCAGGACADATSCLTLLNAHPGLPSREYEIDPDGPGTGVAPFIAYCDMMTDGGGWTTLPLQFDDSNLWSRTQTGSPCVTVDIHDDAGNYRQYQSSTDFGFAINHLRFVPSIAATAVRFVNFLYTNGGSQNTMDFLIGGAPSLAMNTSTSYEGWYFTDPTDATGTPVGYAFPTSDSCVAPYDVEHTVTCSRDNLADRDGGASTTPFFMNATVAFSAAAAGFDMVLVQGCGSYPLDPLMDCEQFHIETAPAADGVWTTGIAVR
jgi:hypothetical protein